MVKMLLLLLPLFLLGEEPCPPPTVRRQRPRSACTPGSACGHAGTDRSGRSIPHSPGRSRGGRRVLRAHTDGETPAGSGWTRERCCGGSARRLGAGSAAGGSRGRRGLVSNHSAHGNRRRRRRRRHQRRSPVRLRWIWRNWRKRPTRVDRCWTLAFESGESLVVVWQQMSAIGVGP
jgi:hypothetical protein